MAEDTIFALSSGRPPAAISIIRVSGPRAKQAGELIAGFLPEPGTAVVRKLHDAVSGDLLDQAVVLRFDAPRSVTGEDVVEFQCHGGRAVVDGVLGALGRLEGLRSAQPGEFTRRAFANGKIDLTEAEGLADLIEAETQSQRKAALALAHGGLRKQILAWQEQALAFSAEAERAIDYDEDDQHPGPRLGQACRALASELRTWLDRPRAEQLKDGARVVLAGPPNAGKSSLLNALVGTERAIVTAVPGTTRDHVDVPMSLEGVPVLITDTAGLRSSMDEVEAVGVLRAAALIEAADVLVWLGEADAAPRHPRAILVHSKADLPGRSHTPEGFLAVSSVSGQGIAELMSRVAAEARSVLPDEDAMVINRRQAHHLEEAADALGEAAEATELVLVAEGLRRTRSAFDRLTGRAGVEEVLDALFARFCLGK